MGSLAPASGETQTQPPDNAIPLRTSLFLFTASCERMLSTSIRQYLFSKLVFISIGAFEMWALLHPNTLSSYYVSPVPDAEPLPTNCRTLNTLCATCTRTLRSPEWTLDSKKHLVDGRPHHPSFQALYEAAKAGCHICTLFWDAMHRNPPDDRRIVDFGSASQEMVLKFLEHPSNRRDIQLDVRAICDWRLEIASFSGEFVGVQGISELNIG